MREQYERTISLPPDAIQSGVVETRTAIIWIRDDGILQVVVKHGAKITLADAKQSITAGARLIEKQKIDSYTVLVDISRIQSIERDARCYFSGENASINVIARAFLVKSPISKIIGNFFLGLNKTRRPLRLFSSKDKALKWLKALTG